MIQVDVFLVCHNTVKFSVQLPLSPQEFLEIENKSLPYEYLINYLQDSGEIDKNDSWSVDDYDVYDHEYDALAERYEG